MIDSHCHLNFNTIKNNFSQIIENAIKKNITSILSINTKLEDFQSHYELIKNYDSIYLATGQHPEYVNKNDIITVDEITLMTENNKVIGIGETGIDLYYSNENIKSQYKSFENHIEASLKTNLPLIIHQRKSENEIIDVLSNYKNNSLSLVMHCFTGSKKLRNFCLDLNYFISLSGIITFKNANDLRNTVKDIPLNF